MSCSLVAYAIHFRGQFSSLIFFPRFHPLLLRFPWFQVLVPSTILLAPAGKTSRRLAETRRRRCARVFCFAGTTFPEKLLVSFFPASARWLLSPRPDFLPRFRTGVFGKVVQFRAVSMTPAYPPCIYVPRKSTEMLFALGAFLSPPLPSLSLPFSVSFFLVSLLSLAFSSPSSFSASSFSVFFQSFPRISLRVPSRLSRL